MKQKRHSVDQIISKLRKADVELGMGKKVSERRACRVLDQPQLLREMRQLARQRPRFGGDRIYKLLVERDCQISIQPR